MERLTRLMRRLDHLQQRHKLLAIAFAIVRKFGEDNASTWALLVAYYGFASLVPLLLVAVTVASIVFAHHPNLVHDVAHSAIASIPVLGAQFASRVRVHALASHSIIGLVVGIAGLIWGAQGVASAAQNAMANVWNVPLVDRPGFLPRTLRNLGILAVLGLGALATSVIAALATGLGHTAVITVVIVVATVAANAGLYVLGFRLLTPAAIATGDLVTGAIVASVVWSILQQIGGVLVTHDLAHASATYGVFGIVLGLIAWFSIATEATLYAAELNVVLVRRLWPRSLAPPPLTTADQSALAALVHQQRARREERVEVHFVAGNDAVIDSQHAPSAAPSTADETGTTATDTP
ncbi:ribonuclease BN [Acidimicrobium ferrooxidans DSM 10331]|uniref:Ribonuclease BN n=1 Tax=Acidimicrobium ferrooxidans (strain DSM 10331 / JCM 15462 / NBRC 103882 / ICP) TaxID=525909 RepID=C7M2B1_ACIFD|nr:YhjD/YihY/BrkB family envelope integrity protein [Acidimicrobium ferrooxidans]ACU54900.1 ribonuclease BN [Acidimicrobium ferrooxidans DSM 10331]